MFVLTEEIPITHHNSKLKKLALKETKESNFLNSVHRDTNQSLTKKN
jgi:hypothetical protein